MAQPRKNEPIHDDAGLAPFVTDITEGLEGRTVIEAMIIIAQASHDLFGQRSGGRKILEGLAAMIAGRERPGLKKDG